MLVIKRIHVVYHLRAAESAWQTVERVHQVHANHCPVYRSLHQAIAITTELRIQLDS